MATSNTDRAVFNYMSLRLVLGIILIAMPPLVSLISVPHLESISASYYSESRNIFVGLLFAVGVLFSCYNGFSKTEKRLSKVGGVAAFMVALFPTEPPCSCLPASVQLGKHCPIPANVQFDCPAIMPSGGISIIHYVAAIILFSIAAYFCLVPFRKRKEKEDSKRWLRKRIYLYCGSTILLCLLVAGVAQFAITREMSNEFGVTYILEWVMLWAFGFAWFVSGKTIKWFVGEEEELHKLSW